MAFGVKDWHTACAEYRKVSEVCLEDLINERDRLVAEVELLVWNLAGCSTIAASRTPQEFNSSMARPALHDVNNLARGLARKDAEISELQSLIDCHIENVRRSGEKMAWMSEQCNLINVENNRLRAALERCRETALQRAMGQHECPHSAWLSRIEIVCADALEGGK